MYVLSRPLSQSQSVCNLYVVALLQKGSSTSSALFPGSPHDLKMRQHNAQACLRTTKREALLIQAFYTVRIICLIPAADPFSSPLVSCRQYLDALSLSAHVLVP